ncbi:hypothetical protein BTN50_0658 [Candidatus Enterovibrio altilux]|uniref:Uncharacterized protein n=1 Tax=Candidatus Enterovibrio altilux TaxID=1927128 RepID=A0A291B876_9GAMM|nr:hypothetical protein BTN50_0658 [Candidatus Enterovibrio luxaltus]
MLGGEIMIGQHASIGDKNSFFIRAYIMSEEITLASED